MTQPAQSRQQALASHFLLRHLQPAELARLAATATVTHHRPNTTIFQKGDPGASMMAVLSGRLKICTYSADGKELVLNIIDRGGLFGEISLLDGKPRSADAVALEDTELLVLTRDRLLPFLQDRPEITPRLLEVLCQRLRSTSEALEDALLRDAPSRVARGLLRLAATFGKKQPSGLLIDIKLSQQQLGNLIGISRESTNRYIVEWTRAGYLAVNNGVITITDEAVLKELAEANL